MKEKWEALRKKYWPPGKDQFLIMALCGLLLAVIAVPVDSGKEKGTQENNGQETETPQETDGYEEQMEKKLEDLLSRVEGVGQVRVMLTFEGSGERKVEKDKQVGTGGTEEETVYEESGSSSRRPYVTSEFWSLQKGAIRAASKKKLSELLRHYLALNLIKLK